MEKRQLGRSEIYITPIIMGTWQAGKRMWVGIEDAETVKAMREAFEAGITTFDTAEVYGEGHSEQIIAEALSDVRSQVVYASKVFANHLKYDLVIEACDRSLKNLNTDYIDLYQIHWPSGTWNSEVVPIAETMSALNKLQEQGKIRAIGVSNFSRAQIEEATQYGRIDSFQLRPIADRHQISLGNLALAWLISQPQTNAIVGARHGEQAAENAQAAVVKLSAEDLKEIDAIGRTVTDHLDDNPVMWNF